MRLQAARAARLHSQVLEDLASGALHLSGLRLLVPHLTTANGEELFAASRHKSKREVEALVRERFPLPDAPAMVRKLPSQATATTTPNSLAWGKPPAVEFADVAEVATEVVGVAKVGDAAEAAKLADGVERVEVSKPAWERTSVIAPLASERYKVQFTANAELHGTLRRAQDLLRHRIPSGDLAQVFELALTALVEKLEKQKFAATDRPRPGRGVASDSRSIPANVKRAVWERDGGRCAFMGKADRRCSETGFLEFHHNVPYATGGAATAANIALRCRSHNQDEGKLEFGPFDAPVARESSAAWSTVV